MKRFFRFSSWSVVFLTFLFLYLPMIVLIVFSFNSQAFPAPWHHFTLHWYHELFSSAELWTSFYNSVIIATVSTLLSLTMGVLLIFLRAQDKSNLKKSISLFYGNLIVPEIILAVGLLSFFMLFRIPLGLPTLIVSHAVIGLGFTIPILYTRYLELDPKLTEASLDLGASSLQTFFRITFPLLGPTLFATGLLIFVISFDDFVISYFCSNASVQTLSIYILSMIRTALSPSINALSTLLVLFSAILVCLFFYPKSRSMRILG